MKTTVGVQCRLVMQNSLRSSWNLNLILFALSVELEMENKYGEFLEQCKSNFLNISTKSLELKHEIRRLRVDLGLPTLQPLERKVHIPK